MMTFVHIYFLVIVVHSFFKLIHRIINLFIHLIYFYFHAEKPFIGMLNKVYVCTYFNIKNNNEAGDQKTAKGLVKSTLFSG